MRFIVDVNHPAHVHSAKNLVWEMTNKGHEVLITASSKDVSLRLLDNYGFKYINLGSYGTGLVRKLINLILIDGKMLWITWKFNPDFLFGTPSIRAAHASFLLRKKCFVFEDTEFEKEQMLLFLPFTNIVFTPTSFNADLGKKQIKINTYKELAYLHPHYFNPDPGVLDALGLIKGDVFFIVRFVSFDATHDVGKYGISNKLELINELQKYGRVFISSEGKLSDDLKEYDLKIEPEKFHSLLYYATLYVGEGGATAREAAFVGTHAVLINSMAKLSGLYSDLNSYGLLWFTDRTQDGLIISKKLLEDKNIWENGKAKLNKLISEKVDFNKFLVWFLENYPDSIIKMKADPGLQYTFK